MMKKIIEVMEKIEYCKIFNEEIYLRRIKLSKNNKFIFLFKYKCLCLYEIIKNIHNTIFWHPKILKSFKKNSKGANILFIETYNRPDLIIDTNTFKYYLNNLQTINISVNKEKKLKLLVFLHVLIVIYKIRKSLKFNILVIDLPFKILHKILFLSEILNYVAKIINLYPVITRQDIVISFQEMSPLENLVCQISKNLGKKTIALCHGIGIEKRVINDKTAETIISAMYSSSVCSYIFCWGNYHKKLFDKYTNSDVRIIGKPSIEIFKSSSDGILFVFDYDMNANNKLLQIAEEISSIGIPVSYWLKPTSELSNNFIQRNGPTRKIVLGEKSSLLIALGLQNYEVYVMAYSHMATILGNEYCVSSANKLIEIYKEKREYDNSIWSNFIELHDNLCIRRFNKELQSIIDN